MTGFGAAAVVVAGDSESDSDSKDENDDDSFTMISSCFISSFVVWLLSSGSGGCGFIRPLLPVIELKEWLLMLSVLSGAAGGVLAM